MPAVYSKHKDREFYDLCCDVNSLFFNLSNVIGDNVKLVIAFMITMWLTHWFSWRHL